MQAPANLATLQAEVQQSRIETSNIFDFNQLKRISESLDFNATSRRTRDDSGDIELHDRRLPDENLKYRIFGFANHVTKYSRLSDTLRSEVKKHCATILFYDSGYKSVKGISKLDRTWRRRMEDFYQTGNDNHPFRGLHKGSKKYTAKFEAENPGLILKYFRYAQKAIGNQASGLSSWAERRNHQKRSRRSRQI